MNNMNYFDEDLHYQPRSKLWKIRDVNGNYDVGTYKHGSMEASVIDCDGDGTEWEVRHHGVVIEKGYVDTSFRNDFYEGISRVETVLIREGYLLVPVEEFDDPDKGEWPTPEDL
jgi:hypothetical protein